TVRLLRQALADARGSGASPALSSFTRDPLRQSGFGELLQGAAAARAPRDPVRAARDGRRGPLEPARGARRPQPVATRADARARRREAARGVERDPLVLRRGNAL